MESAGVLDGEIDRLDCAIESSQNFQRTIWRSLVNNPGKLKLFVLDLIRSLIACSFSLHVRFSGEQPVPLAPGIFCLNNWKMGDRRDGIESGRILRLNTSEHQPVNYC